MKVTEKVTEKVSELGSPLGRVTELGEYLREQRHQAQLSLRQLAEVAGVSNPYLSQVERGLRKPSAEVLQQIAKGLRISAEVLYVRAGILDERDDRMEVQAAVMADPHLTERQRQVLLDIYTTFRTQDERAHGPAVEAVDGADAVEAVDAAPPAAVVEPPVAARTTGTAAAARRSTGTRSGAGKGAVGRSAVGKSAAGTGARPKVAGVPAPARRPAAKKAPPAR